MHTRRKFLLGCSGVAATAAILPGTLLASAGRLKNISADQVAFSTFELCLGTDFRVRSDQVASLALQLVEATLSPEFAIGQQRALDSGNERFSLLFAGPPAQTIDQGSYFFEHPLTGRFLMFVVPAASTETSHNYYEAIFNRPMSSGLSAGAVENNVFGHARNQRPTARRNTRNQSQ
jgi:hypothetical protein